MSKVIVGPGEVATDPKLAIVKKFRMLNKKAGELKQQFMMARQSGEDGDVNEIMTEFQTILTKMNETCLEATTSGFEIWVNSNGKTGHTYANDYKETPDEDNNETARDAAFAQTEILHRDVALRIARLTTPGLN